MIPDTNDDGSWECSYALNTGVMILNLIDFLKTGNTSLFDESVSLFFDTIDFKVSQDFETHAVSDPTEDQIRNHDFYVRGRKWFDRVMERYK